MSDNTCACGKSLKHMNKHNKQLHLSSCKKRKLSITNLKINKLFQSSHNTQSFTTISTTSTTLNDVLHLKNVNDGKSNIYISI